MQMKDLSIQWIDPSHFFKMLQNVQYGELSLLALLIINLLRYDVFGQDDLGLRLFP